jgi:transposase
VLEGYTDANVFNQWLEKCLIPELKNDDVIIIDNASFHKSLQTLKLIEQDNCRLLFLPKYSPDLNKIEPQWANIKSKTKKAKKLFHNIDDAIDFSFKMS